MVRNPLPTSYAGVPLRDVQEAASHADPRTTMRYDRARGSLDRHATYIVAAYVAGGARSSRVTRRRPVTREDREPCRLAARTAARRQLMAIISYGPQPR